MNSIKIQYPNKLDKIFDKLNKNGIKIILVGGYVRDSLLEIESKDIDIELFNLKSFLLLEEILNEFGDINSVGKSFGVCKLRYKEFDLDFSLPRTDSKHSKGHKGFHIDIDTTLDFKKAASRRDFTINSMGYDIREEKLLDPFNGLQDLKSSLIKAVDLKKFGEDPLRVLRAIQFASRFKFKIDETLFIECKNMIQNNILEELPKERIFTELQKLLLKSTQPSRGLELAKKLNISQYFGEYLNLVMLDYYALHKSGEEKVDIVIFLSLLYSKTTLYQLHTITDKIKLTDTIRTLLEVENTFILNSLSDYELYKLATKVNIKLFLLYLDAKYLGEKKREIQKIRERARELNILVTKAPAIIQGRDIIALGLHPSKAFKKILSEAYTAQIKGLFKTEKEAYQWLKRYVQELNI